MAEFDGIRAKLYREALTEFPEARKADIVAMFKYLQPKPGERILEVGAGNGLFSGHIADAILPNGTLVVSDPSREQMEGIDKLKRVNIQKVLLGGDVLDFEENSFDAIWSLGAVHHIPNKTKAFSNFNKALKKGGRLIIIDVFSGSKLAQHFDDRVAKYCATGHEVYFLTREFAESLCFLTGFEKPLFEDIDPLWKFNNKEEIGKFLYKLHAMTKTIAEECLQGAEKILGIEEKDGNYFLHWPLTVIIAYKK